MLSSEQSLMIRMKHSQWYVFIFGTKEKFVLILFMRPALVGFFGGVLVLFGLRGVLLCVLTFLNDLRQGKQLT